MGHVNHAVYFTYFEQCRLICWRELTGSPHPYVRVILARAECDYRSPAMFGDELEIRMVVGDIGNASFGLGYEILQASSGKSVASGRTVMVAYDYGATRPVPLPDATRQLLGRFAVQ